MLSGEEDERLMDQVRELFVEPSNKVIIVLCNSIGLTITNIQPVREERRAGMILEVKLRNFKFLSSENGIGNSTVRGVARNYFFGFC